MTLSDVLEANTSALRGSGVIDGVEQILAASTRLESDYYVPMRFWQSRQ